MVEAKANFKVCTAKRRVISNMICLEEIVGFSFFETKIKMKELTSASEKIKSQEKISEVSKGEISNNL
jgi:DNA-binding protein